MPTKSPDDTYYYHGHGDLQEMELTMAFDPCFGFNNPDSVTLPVQLDGTEKGA